MSKKRFAKLPAAAIDIYSNHQQTSAMYRIFRILRENNYVIESGAANADEKDQAGIAQCDQLKEKMATWYATGRKMAQAYVDGGAPAGNTLMAEFDAESTRMQQALEPIIKGQVEEATREIDSAVGRARYGMMVTFD